MSTPSLCTTDVLSVVTVVVFDAEAHGAGGSLVYGTLQSALGWCGALQRLAPAPRGRIWATIPVVADTGVSRDRRPRRRGARGTGSRMSIPGARFVHGKRPALERLLVEAAHRFLGLGPFAECNKRKPARLPGVAVRG